MVSDKKVNEVMTKFGLIQESISVVLVGRLYCLKKEGLGVIAQSKDWLDLISQYMDIFNCFDSKVLQKIFDEIEKS